MNNNDEQLDQLLRLRFSQKKFVQKEQYWQKAQQLIAADRATNSKEYVSAIFSTVVCIGLSVGMLWNSGITKAIAKQEALPSTQSILVADNSAAQPISTDASMQSKTITGNNETTITPNHLNNQQAKAVASTTTKDKRGKNKPNNKQAHTRIVHNNTQYRASQDIVITKPSIEMQQLGATSTMTYFPVNGVEPMGKKNLYLEAIERRRNNYVAIEAGVNAFNIGSKIVDAVNGHVGMRYYHFVAHKWGLSAGLSYSQIHQHLAARKYDDVNFSFGLENNQTVIVTNHISYVEIPVNIHYNLVKNHYVNAGVTFAYAIQASSDVTRADQDKSQTEYGYLNALNRKDIKLSIGYSYMAGKKWIVTSAYQYGLMDISTNAQFKSNSIDRNSGIRITLGYKLF
jgi:hypothetical protein